MNALKKILLVASIIISYNATAGNKIKAYFNHPVDNSVSCGVNAINLNNYIDDTLVAYINRAKYTLDIAVYNFTHYSSGSLANVALAIDNAYNRGVKIRWIYDSSSTNSGLNIVTTPIKKMGSPQSSSFTIMHNKFMIVDGKSTNPDDAIVWTGSTNWSTNQFNEDYNNIIIIQDSALAHVYLGEFNQMWGDTGMTPNYVNSKFGHLKNDLGRHHFTIEGKHVELYFSPSDNTNDQILNAISTANKDLYFALYAFTFGADATAIINKFNSGVYVAGIIDTFSTNSTYTPHPAFLANLTRSRYKVYRNTGIYHNKYMIVDASDACSDPLVLTGSHNWSNVANTDNDENTLIIHDDTIANLYYQAFRGDFQSMGGSLTIPSGGCPVAINTIADANNTSYVFPNPSNGTVFITYNKIANDNTTIEVLSVDGRLISRQTVENTSTGETTTEIKLDNTGMYFIRLITNNGTKTYSVVNQ